MPKSKIQVNYRFSESLVERLKQRAEAEKISQTELVVRLLEKGLDAPLASKANDLSALHNVTEERMASIASERITQVEKKMKEEIEAIVADHFEKFMPSLDGKFAQQEERIEALEKPLP